MKIATAIAIRMGYNYVNVVVVVVVSSHRTNLFLSCCEYVLLGFSRL